MDEVVALAMTLVGDGQDKEFLKAVSRQWVWEAIKDMPVTEDNMQVCEVKAKNLMIKKPADMRRFTDIALYDCNDHIVPHQFHAGKKRIYPEVFHMVQDSNDSDRFCFPVDVSEDRYSFIIGSNGPHVDYAKIRYFAWPVDNQGEPMIRQDDQMMCVHFIRWCSAMKRNNNQSEIAQAGQNYKDEADRRRAAYKKNNSSTDKNKTIGALFNRMIPSFNRNPY